MQRRDIVLDRLMRCNGDTTRIHEVLNSVGDVGPFTLEEIGQVLHITRERVRQIEQGAMNKLRHPRIGRRLKAYTEMSIEDESTLSYGSRTVGTNKIY